VVVVVVIVEGEAARIGEEVNCRDVTGWDVQSGVAVCRDVGVDEGEGADGIMTV
jgi:hypothetical protein